MIDVECSKKKYLAEIVMGPTAMSLHRSSQKSRPCAACDKNILALDSVNTKPFLLSRGRS